MGAPIRNKCGTDGQVVEGRCPDLEARVADLEAQPREVQSTASILLEDKNTLVAQLKQNTHTAFASGWFAKMEPRGLTLAQALRAHMDTDTP